MRVHGRAGANARRVLAALNERPETSLRVDCSDAAMTFPAASKGMSGLVEAAIAREMSGARRNRVFAWRRCFDLLGEGSEPLLGGRAVISRCAARR